MVLEGHTEREKKKIDVGVFEEGEANRKGWDDLLLNSRLYPFREKGCHGFEIEAEGRNMEWSGVLG
jgi:hypothetical protein